MSEEPNDNTLDDNLRDRLVALGKGAAGLIPMVGGPLAEIIGVIIPGQRADRIAAYLRALAARIDVLSAEIKASIASNAERIALIEEGGYQAARATSPERIAQIVEAVSRGLEADDVDAIRRRRLLMMLGELDDDELALLEAYGAAHGFSGSNPFEKIQRPPPDVIGAPRDVLDQNQLFKAGRDHLLRLGLLKKQHPFVKKGQLPEFDTNSGDFKHSLRISSLGRILLRTVGLEDVTDKGRID